MWLLPPFIRKKLIIHQEYVKKIIKEQDLLTYMPQGTHLSSFLMTCKVGRWCHLIFIQYSAYQSASKFKNERTGVSIRAWDAWVPRGCRLIYGWGYLPFALVKKKQSRKPKKVNRTSPLLVWPIKRQTSRGSSRWDPFCLGAHVSGRRGRPRIC